MILFTIGAGVLVLLAWALLVPAWRAVGGPAVGRAAPLSLLAEQLAAIDGDFAAGQLDADQHRSARIELQRRMLDEANFDSTSPTSLPARAGPRWSLWAVAVAVPVFAAGLYAAIGNAGGLAKQPAAVASTDAEVTPEAVQAMLTTLAQRLEKPSGNVAADLQGWTMLGRSYAVLQRFTEADTAFARAIALAPNDAQLLADRADVLAMVQGQRMAGEPDRLVARSLQIDPRNLKALALAGSGAFERKDYLSARDFWTRARALAPAGSEFAVGLDRSLDDLRVASGDGAATASAGTPTSAAAPTATLAAASTPAASSSAALARIQGRVSLAPALAARVQPTDTVFVFARAAQGPRMPLAIVRRTVADLPFTFTLDDAMAMSPQMKLSGFDRVVVGARVSRSGNALPQAGDLQGQTLPMGTRVDNLDLVIDGTQP